MSSSNIHNNTSTSLPIDLLRLRLTSAEQNEAAVRKHIEDTESKINNIKEELKSLEGNLHALYMDLLDQSSLVEIARKRLQEASPAQVNYWGVSDNHSQFSCGSWAFEATETSTYSVCVTPSKDTTSSTASITAKLYNGKEVSVSKKRFQRIENIKVGDILYMGDKKRKAVFKGVITGQQTKGLFQSNDSSINSLRRRVEDRRTKMKQLNMPTTVTSLENEVEIMWNVQWECVGKLNDAWKDYLDFSDRSRTVRALSSAPAF